MEAPPAEGTPVPVSHARGYDDGVNPFTKLAALALGLPDLTRVADRPPRVRYAPKDRRARALAPTHEAPDLSRVPDDGGGPPVRPEGASRLFGRDARSVIGAMLGEDDELVGEPPRSARGSTAAQVLERMQLREHGSYEPRVTSPLPALPGDTTDEDREFEVSETALLDPATTYSAPLLGMDDPWVQIGSLKEE
jgi:hypothetical protein